MQLRVATRYPGSATALSNARSFDPVGERYAPCKRHSRSTQMETYKQHGQTIPYHRLTVVRLARQTSIWMRRDKYRVYVKESASASAGGW